MRGHTRLLIDFIWEQDLRIVAEIGVDRGRNLWGILDSLAGDVIEEYWGIDPWEPLVPERNYVSGHQLYVSICPLTRRYEQLRLLKMTSAEAVAIFPDGYFDLVYIDGDHRYEAVCNDIALWLPKVRSGGFLGGHDYNMGSVRKAVDNSLDGVYIPTGPHKDLKVWMKDVGELING